VVLGIQRRRERNFISFLNRLRLNPLRVDPGYLFLSLCSRMWVQSQAQLFQDVMALSDIAARFREKSKQYEV
jgi:hypothetical protein